MNKLHVIPGCAYLVRDYINQPEIVEKAIRYEVEDRLKCQLTYAKGWPGRSTKDHKMARFGDEGVTYSYKHTKKPLHNWSYVLEVLRDRIEQDVNDSKYIPELGETPTIVSVSFGATRTFYLYPINDKGKPDKKNPIPVKLHAGDLFVMYGECDSKYMHGMLPEPEANGARLSLTFRMHQHEDIETFGEPPDIKAARLAGL